MSLLEAFHNDKRTQFQKFATSLLKAGEIPKHIAFIMDGNRRYSKKSGISIAEGYQKGLEKMSEALKWCYEFGGKEVTTYAFSIENYKRPEEEKQVIFRLLKKHLAEIIESGDADKFGVAFRVVGDWSHIPDDLKEEMADALVRTRHNSKLIVNLAFAYTSQNEIARGAEILNQGVLAGDIKVSDITEELLTQVLQVFPTNPVDILIRTSDTHRLSDFLMWQTTESVLWFVKSEWPELTFWDLWKSIFEFQRCLRYKSTKVSSASPLTHQQDALTVSCERREQFLEKVRKETWEKLESFCE